MSAGAYLFINVDTGREVDVVKNLKNIPGVANAHIVTGLHDIICYVEGENWHTLRNSITNQIRKITGIQKTVTCIAFNQEDL
ncbi:Lrp/AsnC ligand binding domain-containing protein [bacterium]|nr:Lrp/AsnC ligand binding domain-containing protein [bacterium]